MDEDGGTACPLCNGTGIYPEDAWPFEDICKEIRSVFEKQGWGELEIDEDDDGYLVINTDFKRIGTSVKLNS